MGRLRGAVSSFLDLGTYVHVLRRSHFWAYAHVKERRLATIGTNVSIAPNVSFRNGERVSIGAGAHIGEHAIIWAGDSTGRVSIGAKALFGPHVTLTASNYGIEQGAFVMDQSKVERDIVVGEDVWLGANVVVVAGVTIGDGAIVGAGAVVTKDLPANCIAGGVPARVIGHRPPADELLDGEP